MVTCMIALIQRVSRASIIVAEKTIADIARGLLVFIAIEKLDNEKHAERLAQRILNYRVFSDAQERMNLSVKDIEGSILFVPQFTLAADTQKGLRPSFTPAAQPEEGKKLFNIVIEKAKADYHRIATGQFGAYMQVNLCNDGPVTFLIKIPTT